MVWFHFGWIEDSGVSEVVGRSVKDGGEAGSALEEGGAEGPKRRLTDGFHLRDIGSPAKYASSPRWTDSGNS